MPRVRRALRPRPGRGHADAAGRRPGRSGRSGRHGHCAADRLTGPGRPDGGPRTGTTDPGARGGRQARAYASRADPSPGESDLLGKGKPLEKTKVAVIGSGKIGTDLMIKGLL